MSIVKGLVGLILFFGLMYLGIWFAQNNSQALSLALPGGWQTLEVQLWALVLISAAAGAVLATLVFLAQMVLGGVARRRLQKRIKVLERELNDLRNMPLSAEREPEAPAHPTPDAAAHGTSPGAENAPMV